MGKGNAKGRKKMKRKGIHASISVRKKNLVHINHVLTSLVINGFCTSLNLILRLLVQVQRAPKRDSTWPTDPDGHTDLRSAFSL